MSAAPSTLPFAALMVVAGCSVTNAPGDVQELMIYAFDNFDGDARFPTAFSDALLPFADAHDDELASGLGVDALTAADLAAVGIDKQETEIVGFVASVQMTSSLDEVAAALTYPHMDEVYATTLAFDLHDSTDRACFLAHACETYDLEATRTLDLGLWGQSTQHFTASLRWTATTDGTPVLTLRTLAPDPADITLPVFELDQQYDVQAFYEADGGTRRVMAVWVDALVVGAGVPGELAMNSAVNQMQAGAEDLDAFITSGGVR